MKNEADGQYFKKALSSFIYEFASGDAIRRYAEKGMSIYQIEKKLSFPTPPNKIWEIVWNHYLHTNRILLHEPGKRDVKKYEYVKELSSYGRISYRKIEVKEDNKNFAWIKREWDNDLIKEWDFRQESRQCYVELLFGLIRYKDCRLYQEILSCLSEKQADFVDGLFQKRCVVFYRLDEQMKEILLPLGERHLHEGHIYFSN